MSLAILLRWGLAICGDCRQYAGHSSPFSPPADGKIFQQGQRKFIQHFITINKNIYDS